MTPGGVVLLGVQWGWCRLLCVSMCVKESEKPVSGHQLVAVTV